LANQWAELGSSASIFQEVDVLTVRRGGVGQDFVVNRAPGCTDRLGREPVVLPVGGLSVLILAVSKVLSLVTRVMMRFGV
jgi:hypothetical protein